MKINDILKTRSQGVSFEFFPPKNLGSKNKLSFTVGALKEYRPLYVSMTCGAGGVTQECTKDAVRVLLEQKELVVMPHLTCIGAGKSAIKNLLDEYKQNSIENIMALRGDLPQEANDFDLLKQELPYARDLVTFIKGYGHFCVGVAVYPEGHLETSTLAEDTECTKQKIDAGADFAITQMFFDNTYYYTLLDRMKKTGITIPVLPGILPLTNIAKVKEFASICRATIPKAIEGRIARFSGRPKDEEKAGIEFTIKQCRDLMANGARQLHFFTLNKPKIIKEILEAI